MDVWPDRVSEVDAMIGSAQITITGGGGMRTQLPEGHTVRYRHTRRMTAPDKMDAYPELSAKGGETEAKVYGPDDSVVAIGVATCHERDNFNRRIGRDIALGRALKRLEQKQIA